MYFICCIYYRLCCYSKAREIHLQSHAIFIRKNLHISGPVQFTPTLLKGQLYACFCVDLLCLSINVLVSVLQRNRISGICVYRVIQLGHIILEASKCKICGVCQQVGAPAKNDIVLQVPGLLLAEGPLAQRSSGLSYEGSNLLDEAHSHYGERSAFLEVHGFKCSPMTW